jgi:hypothetical protein
MGEAMARLRIRPMMPGGSQLPPGNPDCDSPPLVAGFVMRGRMGGMRFRKLRIAWSTVCGVAFLLVIGLWLRSMWYWDGYNISVGNRLFHADLVFGRTQLCMMPVPVYQFNFLDSQAAKEHNNFSWVKFRGPLAGFRFEHVGKFWGLIIPNWLFLFLAGIVGIAPWIR